MQKSTNTAIGGLICVCFAINIASAQCTDTEAFLQDRERGWFWGERCLKTADKNETANPPQSQKEDKYKLLPSKVAIPWSLLDKIDPDDISKLETESKKIAIQYPTSENIKEYKLLQKWISDKSFSFMAANTQAVTTDADLAKWKAQTPVNSRVALTEFRLKNQKLKSELISSYADKVSIVAAVSQGCGYCEAQKPILERFKQTYGISYILKDINSMPYATQKLGVATTPDIFIIYNDSGSPVIQRMATGLQPFSDLENGFLLALRSINKLPAHTDKIIFGRD